LTCTGRYDTPAPLSSQYKSYVFYPRHSGLQNGLQVCQSCSAAPRS
jgi:hypothetical protein